MHVDRSSKYWHGNSERTTPRLIAFSSHTGCFARSPTLYHTEVHTHLQFTDIFTNKDTLTLCARKDAQKPIIPIDGVSSASRGKSQPHLLLALWCVCVWGWLVISVYLLKGGGRGHFPCHTTLILPLNHLLHLHWITLLHLSLGTTGLMMKHKQCLLVEKKQKGVCQDIENKKRGWRMCGGRGGGGVLMTGASVNSSSCIDC